MQAWQSVLQVCIGFTAITQRGSRRVDWGLLTRTEIWLLASWLVLIGAFWRVKRAGGFRARWYVKLPKWKRVMVVAGSGFVGLIVGIAFITGLLPTWKFFSPE